MDNKIYTLKGICSDMYLWAIKSPLVMKVFEGVEKERLGDYFGKLFSDNEENRALVVSELYKLVLGRKAEFGPLPTIDLLQNFEYDRVFYGEYRNHTTHMFYVFFLGLMIYERNERIHNAIDNYIDSFDKGTSSTEDIFLFTWTLTALVHDIGYIFENDKIVNDDKFGCTIASCINNILHTPIAHIIKFSSKISSEKEQVIINNNEIFLKTYIGIESLEKEKTMGILGKTSEHAKLAMPGINGLKRYYEFAYKFHTLGGRKGFHDHGICSALLLLYLWSSYRDYVIKIKSQSLINFYGSINKDIEQLAETIDIYTPFVSSAAGAIALHNINKEIWKKSDAANFGLDFDSFCIELDGDGQNLPFAFLLKICDEIQMWNRQRYRAPLENDELFHGEDMRIQISSHHIYLDFVPDTNRYLRPDTDKDGHFYKLLSYLQKYLCKDSVKELLKYIVRESGEMVDESGMEQKEDIVCVMEEKTAKRKEESTKDNNAKWLVGAVNLDEDIHFSSYYLFQSLSCNLPKGYRQFGYENIIAVYDNFNETYYIPGNECIAASNCLIRAGEENLLFWDELLDKIVDKINELKGVFKDVGVKGFQEMNLKELTAIYKKHNRIHEQLYVFARIPEALDRGTPTFSNYLKNYLMILSPELQDDAKLNEVFEILTYPENLTYNGQEIVELYELMCQIREHDRQLSKDTFSENKDRILINMDAEIKEAIQKYSDKWAFWGYHGYRNRALRDFNYFVEKLRVNLKNVRIEEYSKKLQYEMEHNPREKILICSKYNIDDCHKSMFRAFSKIGTIKIYRRYVQLINFYYLDKLISEIATRYHTNESVIRCMFPEEVEKMLDGNSNLILKGKERREGSLFAVVFKKNNYEVICGNEARKLYDDMRKETTQPFLDKGRLMGDSVSAGKVRGIAKVVRDSNYNSFERGNILVCTDTDPDMFDCIKLAGAVVTESGGLTCHAAIVCRELHIPCIVHVTGLMKYVYNGDILEVDANKGEIKIATSISQYIIKSLSYKKGDEISQYVGHKALSLLQMKADGINVPDFICVPINLLRNMFSELEADGKGRESQMLISEIKTAITELDAPFYAIRSSTSREDGENISGAGQELTKLHVSESDVIYTLEQLLNEMDIPQEGLNGSIIIQRMIFGEMSGVMFTQDPTKMGSDGNESIIETIQGGNEHLTRGQITPTRYRIREGEFQLEFKNEKWGGLCSNYQLQLLEQTGRSIENIFGVPQDIEWTIADNRLYILQSRNVTGKMQISESLVIVRPRIKTQKCISIYQSYALPQVLQNHMLRVAAVAQWLIDHWKKDVNIVLDENSIIEALLLHDIGNIVKGDDENFRLLFPDTYPMESFEYWVNIRKWVREHYGKTDTEATKSIVNEIGVGEKILDLIEKKQFVNNERILKENDFSVKICAYADQRVAPEGVMSLQGRLNEAVARYRDVQGASVNHPNRRKLINCAIQIEKQIFEHVDGQPDMITDASIENYMNNLKAYEFSHLHEER